MLHILADTCNQVTNRCHWTHFASTSACECTEGTTSENSQLKASTLGNYQAEKTHSQPKPVLGRAWLHIGHCTGNLQSTLAASTSVIPKALPAPC